MKQSIAAKRALLGAQFALIVLIAFASTHSAAQQNAAAPACSCVSTASASPAPPPVCTVIKSACDAIPSGIYGHPHPQPRPAAPSVITPEGNCSGVLQPPWDQIWYNNCTVHVSTSHSIFEPSDPFNHPPGTNFLPNVDSDIYDGCGKKMSNTLPSTQQNPYNLQAEPPKITPLDHPQSPTDDLREVIDTLKGILPSSNISRAPSSKCTLPCVAPSPSTNKPPPNQAQLLHWIQRGIDILEGNPIPDRMYSELPILHYKASSKIKSVVPIRDGSGKVIGGNVDVHQVWFDNHIESDTAFLDVSAVQDVPWTVTYTVDVLTKGHDDFSPFVMYFDPSGPTCPPGMKNLPHVGMDQSYYPMDENTRNVFKIKMAEGKYFNLIYTWGWRMHPPRVQVMENASKPVARPGEAVGADTLTTLCWEKCTFEHNGKFDKTYAIARIGDVAPEKKMWNEFLRAKKDVQNRDYKAAATDMVYANYGLLDWMNRNRLPYGVKSDPNSDITLLYANNTIYGEIENGGYIDWPKWTTRGTTVKVTLYNADYFEHAYQNVDFGGLRGWENQYQSTVALKGSGCWFTFGRVHWWMNLPASGIVIPPASPYNQLGKVKVEMTFNYDPSRRLRFYQFDPRHHDVAVFSIH